MVMTVDAGAVAEASAASTAQNARSSPRMKYVSANTNTDATHASSSVMTITPKPLFLSVESLKNSPTLNAMNASAISEIKSMPEMTDAGIRFRQYGPIRIPVRIYAVTSGRRSAFVILVMAKPRNSISATEMITPAVCPDCASFCGKAPNIGIPPVPLALGYEI